MTKILRILPVVVAVFFIGVISPAAQTKEDREAVKRDVFLILDVSGSMNEAGKFRNVKEYLEKEVFGNLLKSGDEFTLITFGNTAKETLSRTIGSEADKRALLDSVRGLTADDNYTDIGTAMEKLAAVLSNRSDAKARQVILFITDGKNTPPRGSAYHGKDLSLDERFRSVGEKIAKSGWFLYVIGIGAETDAKKIADSVSGSVYQKTDEKLSDIKVAEYVQQVDNAAKTREDAARAEAEKAAFMAEAEKRAADGPFGAFVRKLSDMVGISFAVLSALLVGLLVLLLLVLLYFLYRVLRPVRVVISDNVMGKADTLERRLAPWSGIMLNSVQAVLPGIGDETRRVFRLERGLFGLRVRVEDETAIAAGSPYGKAGVHPLSKTIIELANGNRVRIAVKK